MDSKLSGIYQQRFSEKEILIKDKLWKVLIEKILQKYVRDNDTVADIGGGECLFINNVKCGKKYVVDLNPDTKKHANNDVTTIQKSADDISTLTDRSIDVVFVSNFLEHMKDKDELERVIAEIKRILTFDGLLIIIQPNIRYAFKEYWDFFDHYIPLTDKSITELLIINKFRIKICHSRFLPFTTKSSLSKFVFLFKFYIRLPLLWRIFGKQSLIVAQNTSNS